MDYSEIDMALKTIMIHYLHDSEIQSVIKNIMNRVSDDIVYDKESQLLTSVAEKELIEYKELIQRYQERNRLLDEENKCLKSFLEENKREIAQLNLKNESLFKEKENILNRLNENEKKYFVLSEQYEIWNKMELLNTENKEYLKKLCGSYRVMPIISLGRDEGKIYQLWTYIRDIAVKGIQSNDQIDILSNFFEYCIELSNSCNNHEEKYERFEIEKGNDFDTEMCIRTAHSKQIGKVSDTLVKGIRKENKIIFKPIVNVE